jgi:hypothetical protein
MAEEIAIFLQSTVMKIVGGSILKSSAATAPDMSLIKV